MKKEINLNDRFPRRGRLEKISLGDIKISSAREAQSLR